MAQRTTSKGGAGKAAAKAGLCPAQDGLLYGEDATQPGPIF